MIRKIKFSNFYSFSNEHEINFLTSKKKTFDFTKSKKNGEQISKISGFIGGNASGKTNVIRAFSFISHFIVSKDRSPVLDIAYKTFFDSKKESSFEIEIELKNKIFKYKFITLENIILHEELKVKNLIGNSRLKTVFIRKTIKDNDKISTTVDLKNSFIPNGFKKIMKSVRPDVSIVSFINSQFNIEIITELVGYFNSFSSNINEEGQNHPGINYIEATEYYLKNVDALKDFVEFIRNFDLGIIDIKINKEVLKKDIQGENVLLETKAVHKSSQKDEIINWIYESNGTRQIYNIFAKFHRSLKFNSVIIFDELETGMHPESFKKIIRYFINKNENGSAQLIFTSHTLDFLKSFDAQQIFLVEKNKNSESDVYRLDELKLRPEENFYSKYMSGSYGAFPDIKI